MGISNARLYDATNINVQANKYWIHSLDTFNDVAPAFVAAPVFSQLTPGTITSANTEFALINTSVTNKSWTLYMDIKLPSVYNSKNPFKINGTWSHPSNQTIDTWTEASKYFFIGPTIGSTGNYSNWPDNTWVTVKMQFNVSTSEYTISLVGYWNSLPKTTYQAGYDFQSIYNLKTGSYFQGSMQY